MDYLKNHMISYLIIKLLLIRVSMDEYLPIITSKILNFTMQCSKWKKNFGKERTTLRVSRHFSQNLRKGAVGRHESR